MQTYEVQLEKHEPLRFEAETKAQAWALYKERMGVVRTKSAIRIRIPGDGPAEVHHAGDLESQAVKEQAKAEFVERQEKAAAVHAENLAKAGKDEPVKSSNLTTVVMGANTERRDAQWARDHLAKIKDAGVIELRELLAGLAEETGQPKPDLRQKKAVLLGEAYGLLILALGGTPSGNDLELNSEILTDRLDALA